MQCTSVAVGLRPPDARDEWEASWYRERLADPSLIAAGVVVVVAGRIGYLAVPVGGQRRGGYIPVGDAVDVPLLLQALDGRPGFPAVRVRWSTCESTCHVVEWGDVPPDTDDDAVRGRFYGYSERAMARFDEEIYS
jgi:hypothetical protein